MNPKYKIGDTVYVYAGHWKYKKCSECGTPIKEKFLNKARAAKVESIEIFKDGITYCVEYLDNGNTDYYEERYCF